MKPFAEQVVWITGAGSGLGKAMVHELATHKAILVLSGRRKEPLEQICAELVSKGIQAVAIPCDVADEEQIRTTVQMILDRFHKLDVVIANAGFGVSGAFSDLSAADWSRQYQVNVIGLTQTVRHALPHLKVSKGRIALVGSVAGFVFASKSAPYCSSKAAVHAIGECLALELYGTGVSCTTIHPGFVESDIARVDNNGVFHEEAIDKRPAHLMWKAEDAARVMIRAIEKRKRIYVFTWHGKLGAFLGRHLPSLVYFLQTRFKNWK